METVSQYFTPWVTAGLRRERLDCVFVPIVEENGSAWINAAVNAFDFQRVDWMAMTIETDEQYTAAIERLEAMGDNPAEGPDQDEYFDISAAMVAYETRMRPVTKPEGAE